MAAPTIPYLYKVTRDAPTAGVRQVCGVARNVAHAVVVPPGQLISSSASFAA